MAFNARNLDVPSETAFAAIADPSTYPDWLLGAANIRDIDDNWPSPGSRFHHTVGVRPFAITDSTEVLDIEPGTSLTLDVRARPLVSGIVHFTVGSNRDGSVITMLEEPAIRPIGDLVRPLLDPTTHLRNQRSLARLESLLRTAAPTPARAG